MIKSMKIITDDGKIFDSYNAYGNWQGNRKRSTAMGDVHILCGGAGLCLLRTGTANKKVPTERQFQKGTDVNSYIEYIRKDGNYQ